VTLEPQGGNFGHGIFPDNGKLTPLIVTFKLATKRKYTMQKRDNECLIKTTQSESQQTRSSWCR